MKTKIHLAFLMLVAAFSSCDKPILTDEVNSTPLRTSAYSSTITITEGNYPNRDIVLSPNQIIVRLDPTLSKRERKQLRSDYFVTDTTVCSCGDTSIQLWTIDTSRIGIEDAVGSINTRGGTKVNGDRHFSLNLQVMPPFVPRNKGANAAPLFKVPTSGSVNVAVIDTGLDYSEYLIPGASPFLYQTADIPNCYPTTSGWSFVDNSTYFMDENGHGTYVTKIITDQLTRKGINFTILPLKIFNKSGVGTYWDAVCAIGYIKEIQKKGGNIGIVNASFGGTLTATKEHQIFNKLLEELSSTTLVISSAGNHGLNNDEANNAHFLTSYTSPNILGVGGFSGSGSAIKMDERSNYGQTSIDLAAPFSDYKLSLTNGNAVSLAGTSYGAAYTSGIAAELAAQNSNPKPELLKSMIFGTTFQASGLQKKVSGNRALLKL